MQYWCTTLGKSNKWPLIRPFQALIETFKQLFCKNCPLHVPLLHEALCGQEKLRTNSTFEGDTLLNFMTMGASYVSFKVWTN